MCIAGSAAALQWISSANNAIITYRSDSLRTRFCCKLIRVRCCGRRKQAMCRTPYCTVRQMATTHPTSRLKVNARRCPYMHSYEMQNHPINVKFNSSKTSTLANKLNNSRHCNNHKTPVCNSQQVRTIMYVAC